MNDSQRQASRPVAVNAAGDMSPAAPLPSGWRLAGWEIQRAIARSESSVVYRATDHNLDLPVALQEYLPARFARRDASQDLHGADLQQHAVMARGLQAFIAEARLLARCDHPSLVRVSGLFEAHGTAYRVMPLYEGRRLLDLRRDMLTPPDEASLRSLLTDLLGALETFHHSGQAHGGVTPANILLLADDRPLLLGPGAADREIASNLVESLMAGLEPSFEPPQASGQAGRQRGHANDLQRSSGTHQERSSGIHQERSSGTHLQRSSVAADLYALAEVLRFCITGELPAASTAPREREPLAADIARRFGLATRPRYSAAFLSVLDAAGSPVVAQRPHSAAQFRDWLDSREPREHEPAAAGVEAAAPNPSDGASAAAATSSSAPLHALDARRPGSIEPTVGPAETLPSQPQSQATASAASSAVDPVTTDHAIWVDLSRAARARRRVRLIGGTVAFASVLIVSGSFAAWSWMSAVRADRYTVAAARSVAVLPRPPVPAAAPAPAEPPAPATTVTTATTAPAEPLVDEALARVESADPTAAGPAAAPPAAPPPVGKPPTARNTARKPAARAATQPAQPLSTASTPRAACSPRTEFALYRCMQTQCRAARWAAHPQCRRLRTEGKVG